MLQEQSNLGTMSEEDQENVLCMAHGIILGCAATLVMNNQHTDEQDVNLEEDVVAYIGTYINALMLQGLPKDALAFLMSQMETASQIGADNTNAVAYHLIGSALEKLSNAEKHD